MADKPDYEAFVAVKTKEDSRDPRDTVWVKIGAAWQHKDGNGINIVLHALPHDGKLVLRKPLPPKGDGDA